MKSTFAKLALSFALCACVTSVAMADGSAFTPLNFDDTVYGGNTTQTTVQTINSMASQAETAGNESMQSAILKLDNAQVEVRNQLLNYRTSFSELDNKYKTVKTERKAAKKKIKQAEKRIKNLEKAKKKIRKNFEQKINM